MKEFREQVGITQEVLAKEIGVSQGAIAHYENGRRTPELDVCRDIVETLNQQGIDVTLDDVFPPKQKQKQAA